MIQEGSAAIARKDYPAAIEIYTKAIDEASFSSSSSSTSSSSSSSSSDTTTTGTTHLARLYSNRAICYYHSAKYTEAIKDADKAITYDRTFPKPRITKAGCLEKLGRYSDAENEYRTVLRTDPSHPTAQDNLDRLELQRTQREERQRQRQQQAYNPQGWDGTGLPPTPPRASYAPSEIVLAFTPSLRNLLALVRIVMFLLALAYVLPLGAISYQAYYTLLLLALVSHSLQIFVNHGFPPTTQLSMQAIGPYVQRILMDVTLPSILLPFIFYSTRPMPIALLAIALVDFYLAGEWFNKSISKVLPITSRLLAFVTQPLSTVILDKPTDTVNRMRHDEYRNQMYDRLLYYESLFEILLGIILIIELIFPYRALLPTMMIWMGFNQKYLFNPYVRSAFGTVDQRITSIVTHRLCPGIIGNGYTSLKNMLYNRMVDMVSNAANQQRNGGGGGGRGGGGMMSNCVIM